MPSNNDGETKPRGWKKWQGLLAWYVLIIFIFLTFFTVKEIERLFGEEKIRGMFFRTHEDVDGLGASRDGLPKHLPS